MGAKALQVRLSERRVELFRRLIDLIILDRTQMENGDVSTLIFPLSISNHLLPYKNSILLSRSSSP